MLAGQIGRALTRRVAAGALPLDGLSVPAAGLWCRSARLRTAYTGPLTRVRSAADDSEANVAYNGSNLADTAALIAHCFDVVPVDGFEPTLYDQSGNGRNLTQTIKANQPQLYDGGTEQLTVIGDELAAHYGAGDITTRNDACGLSGAVAITLWVVFKTASATGFPSPIHVGHDSSAGQMFELYMNNAPTQLRVAIGGAARTFTCTALNNGSHHSIIASLAAGAPISTARCWQNGVELSQVAVVNGANTASISNTFMCLGSGGRAGYNDLNGPIDAAAVFAAEIGADDRAILNAFAARY